MSLGVVVGRFQADTLHHGHEHVLRVAAEENDKLLVVIGASPLPTTRRNPLSVKARAQMIAEHCFTQGYNFDIVTLHDHPSDHVWSQNLDKLIFDHLTDAFVFENSADDNATLYHGRDGFSIYYDGVFAVKELNEIQDHAASVRREEIGRNALEHNKWFRQGVIWANQNRFPTVYGCVDAACVWRNPFSRGFAADLPGQWSLLVITKPGIEGYMLPGGFCEPGSESDEDDARREVLEETNIDLVPWIPAAYLGSFRQNDWRYAGEVDEIRTRLFLFDVGEALPLPSPGDDAETAEWVDLSKVSVNDFNPCHHNLYHAVAKYLSNKDRNAKSV